MSNNNEPKTNMKNENTKSYYTPRFTANKDGSVFTMIVRVDPDGFEQVSYGFKARHFANQKNAVRAAAKYLEAIAN